MLETNYYGNSTKTDRRKYPIRVLFFSGSEPWLYFLVTAQNVICNIITFSVFFFGEHRFKNNLLSTTSVPFINGNLPLFFSIKVSFSTLNIQFGSKSAS